MNSSVHQTNHFLFSNVWACFSWVALSLFIMTIAIGLALGHLTPLTVYRRHTIGLFARPYNQTQHNAARYQTHSDVFFFDLHNEGSYNTTQLTVTLRCTNIQSLVVNQTQHALPDALCTRCTRRHETLHCQMHYVDALWLQTAFPGQLKIGERQAVCGGLTQDPFNSKYIAISDPTEHF